MKVDEGRLMQMTENKGRWVMKEDEGRWRQMGEDEDE